MFSIFWRVSLFFLIILMLKGEKTWGKSQWLKHIFRPANALHGRHLLVKIYNKYLNYLNENEWCDTKVCLTVPVNHILPNSLKALLVRMFIGKVYWVNVVCGSTWPELNFLIFLVDKLRLHVLGNTIADLWTTIWFYQSVIYNIPTNLKSDIFV